jgi:hypothetical protein
MCYNRDSSTTFLFGGYMTEIKSESKENYPLWRIFLVAVTGVAALAIFLLASGGLINAISQMTRGSVVALSSSIVAMGGGVLCIASLAIGRFTTNEISHKVLLRVLTVGVGLWIIFWLIIAGR